MPQTEARFDLRAAAAVVRHRDAHAHRRRVSVPDGIGDALLHDAVHGILLIRRQAQLVRLQIQRNLRL